MRKFTSKSKRVTSQPRGPYTPKAKQQRVIERHISGQSQHKIAGEEHLDRGTVRRIVSQPEVAQFIEQSRLRILGSVPKAISVFERALASDDPRTALTAATRILECTQVLHKAGPEMPSPEEDQARRKREMLGAMTEMILYKHHKFGMDLPPGYERIEEEAKLRLEEETKLRLEEETRPRLEEAQRPGRKQARSARRRKRYSGRL